ncbi:hypothetical protein Back2_16120 [Nocardioides baekrokdamisoli]|uniref:NERD domain-containing protein n=1 Tax=Nocardioides baekrokdamisoli TaxID=1804624 RepID=A0A3G9IMS8_9ACTN|nr:nuclease-related domain-containing protein [Nocardioides baekrokdamisoli]BBH17325.1 hypothetical protein Back2_16120 [Nocardioides baekrokdamisoli]
MTILSFPHDLGGLLADDGSIDLALNEPGYGARVRKKQAWWGDTDDEMIIGRHLNTFADSHEGWHVLHSVHIPSMDVDLDAVVVGPAGVFIVQAVYTHDARVWAGGDAFIVEGRRRSTIVDARATALCARALMELKLGFNVPVSAIVVPVGASHVDIPLMSEGVAVVEPDALTWWLGQLASPWPSDVADSAYDIARRSSTWEAA